MDSKFVISESISLVTSILVLGTILNGLLWVPYQIQLAYGWTKLSFISNLISVFFIVIILCYTVPTFGIIGAPIGWLVLNMFTFFITTYYVFKKVLKNQKNIWIKEDIIFPLISPVLISFLASSLISTTSIPLIILYLLLSISISIVLSIYCSSKIKPIFLNILNTKNIYN